MSFQKIPALPDYAWAEIVSLLRFYFDTEDLEWEGYAQIFGAGFSLKLIDLNELCENYTPPPPVPTIDDYVSGAYKDILWEYALAALACESCEDA